VEDVGDMAVAGAVEVVGEELRGCTVAQGTATSVVSSQHLKSKRVLEYGF
jgi:hypothetical protein